jgi:dihydroxy-acid dehydratase
VFDSYPDMKVAVDSEDFPVTPDTVMVLRNAGPQGGPGMPEWGMLPIPKALIKQGHRDMLRISDARMSGTSYGACVLHVAPESHVGGPLALLKTGDRVRLNLPERRLDMLVSDEELARRRAEWVAPQPCFERGWGWIYSRHVTQADKGCDFDFLETQFGRTAGEPDIY